MINIKNQDCINASKALLSILLTLLCIHSYTTYTEIYFALYATTCCAFMQIGDTKIKQFISMLLAGSVFLFLLGFGLFIKSHALYADISLIILAFIAFYLPNFGLAYKISPSLGLVFYTLVIYMPTPTVNPEHAILASATGAVIAMIIYFLLWPYDVKHELTLVAQTLCGQYRMLLRRYSLITRRTSQQIHMAQLEQIQNDLDTCSTLLASYEKLNEEGVMNQEESPYFDTIYLKLYSLLQINRLMVEHFPRLSNETRPLCQYLLKDLSAELREIEYRFNDMVPHSLIAKYLIHRSFNLGKKLTRPILKKSRTSNKAIIPDNEFYRVLEQLITDLQKSRNKQFAFGLLRIRELLQELFTTQAHQSFELKGGMFL